MTAEQRATVDELLRHAPIDFGGDVAEQRTVLHDVLTAQPVPDDVAVASVTLNGVPALTVEIADRATEGTVLYFHGGVFALGSAQASVGLAAEIARRAHTRVITVDYRLAPEHPYPAAVDDSVAAYRALLDDGTDPSTIAIAGESAGGNIAVAALVALRDAGLPRPGASLLMSPWVDLAVTGPSSTTKAGADPALTPDALKTRALDYVVDLDPLDPRVSPLAADLHDLPPLLIQVGTNEILLDDSTRLATRAASHNVDVVLDVTANVPHVFQAFAGLLDEGAEALDRAAHFLTAHR